MPFPRVSVCIDNYNYADYLPAAIESVLAQTWTDFELLVVDDCSTDDSGTIARAYEAQDNRVRVCRNPSNLGMIGNRNQCLSLAQGEYVKFLHADDFLCSPDALRRLVERMDSNPAASLSACAMQFVRPDGQPSGASPSCFPDSRFVAGTSVIARCLREQKNLIGGPSAVLVRRSRAGRGFDTRYFHAADLEMWFHLLEQGCFGYIGEPLVAYRWHPQQQTEKDRRTLSQAEDQRAMLTAYLNKPYIRMRPWLKEYLEHDAARQYIRRARKIGQAAKAVEAVQAHGKARFYKHYAWCLAWRKTGKRLSFLRDQGLPPALLAPPANKHPRYPQGINVAGFLKGQYGIGESSRAFCRAVAASGLPTVSVNIQSRDHSNQDESVAQTAGNNPYGINLMTFSFDYARRFYRDKGRDFFAERYNIALWYWELETFPARWHGNFDYYDEIWAPSRFCRDAFAQVSPIPVRHITYPLEQIELEQTGTGTTPAPHRAEVSRFAGREISADACVFLFNFDFFSTLARKNPLGLLDAFGQAFRRGENVLLILKSINSRHVPEDRAQIAQAVAELKSKGLNVVWIEEHLTGAQMQTLFACADCYVSLHRAEGLGLGMAQAMAQGKPVVATGYSGSMEYMTAENSLLVAYKRVELAADYGAGHQPPVYEKGNIWAEPNSAHAAEQMRWVYLHPEEAARIGERAQQDIRNTLNPAKTQAEIRACVDAIYK